MTTNLKPDANPELKSSAGKFYIEGITYTKDIQKKQKSKAMLGFDQRLLILLRSESFKRYPELFTDDSSSGIPLWVDISQVTNDNKTKTLTWMLCTGMLCGIIFPLPGEMEEKFDIKTGVWNGQGGIRGESIKNNFQRDSEFWVSVFTPTALITIPGESDVPKISGTILDTDSQMKEYELITAQQIATSLAKSISEKDASYWKTMPSMRLKGSQSLPEAIPFSTNQADAF